MSEPVDAQMSLCGAEFTANQAAACVKEHNGKLHSETHSVNIY